MIKASLVKELREQTGAGMMECKKALEEAQGDVAAAVTIMRKAGQAKAAKKAGRTAAEGLVVTKIDGSDKTAIIVEVNCETDFAAKDSSFVEFVDLVATQGLKAKVANLDDLLKVVLDGEQTILAARDSLVAKIGENVNIRRMRLLSVADDSRVISSYVHGNGRIGVLVEFTPADYDLGKNLAMHIAASKPIAMTPDGLAQNLLRQEEEIYRAELQNSGKPKEIVDKIVAGRIQKFIGEMALIKQPFVKDPDVKIETLLQNSKASIFNFVRFEVGDGIEKEEIDFAAEVQAQVSSQE